MFKRLALLALTMVLFATQSFAVTNNGLKAAFDELTFTMEYDGAALDPVAKEEALAHFTKQVDVLRLEGLTNQELVDFVQSQVKDSAIKKEIAATYALIQTEKMSQEEVRGLLNTMSSKIYAKGASWSGDTGTTFLIVGLLAVVIAVSLLIPPSKCANEAYARGNIEACQDSSYNGRYYNI